MPLHAARTALALAVAAIAAGAADARVTELVIEKTETLNNGSPYGAGGVYQRLRGYAKGELDPGLAANTGIVNIAAAPRNAAGMVEYRVDVEIHRPVDPAKGNGSMLYEVVNRGNQLIPSFIETPTPLLHERGFTLVWSGWQGDIPSNGTSIVASFPVASQGGQPIVAPSREEFVDRGTSTWTGALQYPAATLDKAAATLTVREREADPRTPVATWSYVNDRQIQVTPPGAPFDAGAIYEFIYPAKDPIVAGIGFAATRDVNAFLRYAAADDKGTPNPLAGRVSRTLIMGVSQSGRYTRDFLYQGFNADESGRRVFDGAMPIIPGSRKTWTNFQFAQPGRWSKQHEEHLQPGDQFPFAYSTTTDPLTGRTDGVLAKCGATDTCPKVVHVDGEFEVWGARGSLLVSDGAPDPQPIRTPRDVRLYFVAGTPHGGSNLIVPTSTNPGICKNVNTPLGSAAVNRALILALDDWVAGRASPPPSRYGHVDDERRHDADLVAPNATGFPAIPGVTYTGLTNYLNVTDYTAMPPVKGAQYTLRVPKVDADGNSLAGIRLPAIEAPIATYTGWNVRSAGNAEYENCLSNGSYLPFARTRAERMASGDPRPSLEERYRTQERYVRAFGRAADALVRQGYLLADDAAMMVEQAQALDLGLKKRD